MAAFRATGSIPKLVAYQAILDEDFEDEVDPTPPDVSLDLLIKYQRGEMKQNLVLKVQDTGGVCAPSSHARSRGTISYR